MSQPINPNNVQSIRHWVRALLQGLAHYDIVNESEQATALKLLATELEILAALKGDPTSDSN